MQKPIVIATRRSPLALAQAENIRALLGAAAGLREAAWEDSFPLKTFVTIGDRNLQSSLADVGGKGLFVKEIEMALLTGEARLAVHSMKDMPAEMPPGLIQVAVPTREDPRDAFVSLVGSDFEDLPEGARVGTSSVRRAAQILRLRPDLEIVPFRGNVATRLAKLERGEADGTFLAEAGLRRLGLDEVKRRPIPTERMLPALGQGALCIQAREDDDEVRALAAKINCAEAELTTTVERAFVGRLDGSCRTPMAGMATQDENGRIRFRAQILTPDGQTERSADHVLSLGGSDRGEQLLDALAEGAKVAADLLADAPEGLRDVIITG
jgi:hydroxymethylbilane synthase